MKLTSRVLLVLALAAAIAPARADLFEAEKFTVYGDFRIRGERDWDSQDAAGVEREDRTRLRARLRAGVRFDPTEHWQFEARIRSGAEAAQQSPHITLVDFDDNDTGDASFSFDRWYLRGKVGDFHASAGRNHLPFWKQDEVLFDDDVSMIGLAAGWAHEVGPGALSVTGGYFSPPVGMRATTGNMGAAQVIYQPEFFDVNWTFGLGTYVFEAEPADPDAAGLLSGNGSRDYQLIQGSVQARFPVRERPLVLGVDLLHNAEDYSVTDPDPVTAANADETDGHVLLATWGSLDAEDGWLVGYYYGHVETFAVHNSYAQDDWVRWGNATQTRTSDLEGHELRFGWAFNPKLNVLTRLYLAEAITTVEDGKRLRVDFNYEF
jgi:hypothetical protein